MQKIRPPYLRILGIGFGGEEILRQMKKTAVIPFSQSLARLSEESEDAKPVCAAGSGGYRPIRAWNAKTAVLRLGVYRPSR